ncbi:MAG: tetratricopeptide repeat protein [Candidatus Hydrogenedentes bacterium]|nr:tetratricopeptide repeat protein [Candidatus Hydrogenedentota bacterium]
MRTHPHSRLHWLGAMLVIITALAGSGCSERRAAQFAEQGDTYFLLGNIDEAAAAYDRALAANPKNGAAKLGQARCFWIKKQPDAALKAYKEAVALDATLDKAYIEGVRASLAMKNTATAEELSSQYIAVKPDLGGILHAAVLRDTNRATEAVTELRHLRDAYPKSVEVRVNLAGALISAKDPAAAEQELKTTLSELDKDSLPARMMLVEAYRAQGKLAEIENEFRALAEQRPDDAAIQLSLARTLLASNKLDEAEKIAQPILEKTPESPWANYVIGACLLAKGKREDAITCLEAAAGALPNDPQIAKLLSEAQSGSATQTASTPTPATGSESASSPAQWQTLWRDASLKELVTRRQEFLVTNENNVAEGIALAAVFSQNVPVAREMADSLAPDSRVGKYINALLSRDANKLKDAIDTWQEAIPDRRIMRANAEGFALAISGARAQALRVFSQCIQEYPDNGVAFYNVAGMFRSAGMPKFALGTLKQLISRHSDNREARQALFETMMEAGMTDDARRQAESAFALFPEDAGTLLNLSRVYRDSGESALAEEVLRKGVERVSDKTRLNIALTELLLARGETDKADEVLKTIPETESSKQQRLLLSALVAAARTQWDNVLARCSEAAGPNYPMPTRLLHVAALVKAGKIDEAGAPMRSADGEPLIGPSTNILLRALGVAPNPLDEQSEALANALKENPDALHFFAYGLSLRELRLMRDAYTMFRTVDEKVPGNPRLVEFVLSAAARANDMPDRVALATQITEKYPEMAAAWLGLADVQAAMKNGDAEKAALEKAANVEPANEQPWRRLARYYSDRFDYTGLLDASRHVVELLPEDPYAANNLAYCILQTGGDANEALQLASKALEKLPRNAEVIHTLGLAQVRTGNTDEGRKNLTVALEMRPGDPTLMLDYGKLLIEQNQAEEGRNNIQLALRYADQLGLDFPRRAEAEQAIGQRNS